MTTNRLLFRTLLERLLALLLLAFAGSSAMAQTDPPARVASLSHIEGSVVLAPAGDTEWTDAVLNRPITRGDRLWTDRGARAEVHLGSAVLHMDGETLLDVTALDDQVLQASLNQGAVNARVRQLEAGENFEIDTPQLAFRASQPGDYRIDVDPARGTTRVTVRSGIALVYGASGEAQQLQPGQQIVFAGRDLERVAVQASPMEDGFDRWAADRNRREDQSIAARYVPREVVGYQQLDPYGSWAQDPTYGAIWFPRIVVADWAPYRYGRWEWIAPWGWTWIDDAPWGFAPFHYGRWTTIGSRWAWVPGRIGPRPIYAPALVVFVGGGGSRGSWSLSIGSSPGIAWYPLAPGEAWRPAYRASPVYVRNVNRNIVVNSEAFNAVHIHQRRAEALTAVRVEDFSRGRPVHSHWTRVNPAEIARARVAPLSMPEPRRFGEAGRAAQPRTQPPTQIPAPAIVGRPQPQAVTPGLERREPVDRSRPREDSRQQPQPRRPGEPRSLIEVPRPQPERPPQVRQEEQRRDQQRAQDEQRRQQVEQLQRQQQERARRDQQAQQERVQREQQVQAQRQQEERRAQQAQIQREHALRQQQAAQERLQRQQQERARRDQQVQQERVQREQQVQAQRQQEEQRRAQQGQIQREHALRQQQAAQERLQRQQQPQVAPPATAQPTPPQRGAERGRQAQDPREERRSPGDDDGRGRGRGQGRGD